MIEKDNCSTVEDKDEKMKKQSKVLDYAKWLLAIGIFFIVVAPFLLTRSAFSSLFDFTTTGNIGDTIGGITAPFVNLVGAILVYFALKAQVDANQIIQEQILQQKEKEIIQFQTEEINILYSNLKDSIDNYTYSTLDCFDFGTGRYITGSEAIYKLFTDLYCDNSHLDEDELKGNPKITELIGILKICNGLIEKINASQISNKEVMRILTCQQFRYRIMPKLNTLDPSDYERHFCNDCDQFHGLPQEMIDLIKKLNTCTDVI